MGTNGQFNFTNADWMLVWAWNAWDAKMPKICCLPLGTSSQARYEYSITVGRGDGEGQREERSRHGGIQIHTWWRVSGCKVLIRYRREPRTSPELLMRLDAVEISLVGGGSVIVAADKIPTYLVGIRGSNSEHLRL